eukprot:c35379_g1_i1 orf=119-325(+)
MCATFCAGHRVSYNVQASTLRTLHNVYLSGDLAMRMAVLDALRNSTPREIQRTFLPHLAAIMFISHNR